MKTITTNANATKADRLQEMLRELLQQALQRGFFGTARIEFVVQDGTIQHLRRSLEQMEK
jgi:hypothetical protein